MGIYFTQMQKNLVFFLIVLSTRGEGYAQDSAVFFKGAIKENRNKVQRNIIQNTITKNLSLPLNGDTEDNWTDAFEAMELTRYNSPWTDAKVQLAFDSIGYRGLGFQRSLLELAYARYPRLFAKQAEALSGTTPDSKIYAMCIEYLLLNSHSITPQSLAKGRLLRVKNEKDEAIEKQLLYHVTNIQKQNSKSALTEILSPSFLKNNIVLYSIQRKNRNYPGLVIIKDSTGNFVKDDMGHLFSVPQLAKSIANLPCYLTNGNTPQGIYRMYGFAISRSNFIGPSANVQLTMPFETSIGHFLNDSTITDTVWTEDWYKKLLPPRIKNYQPFYESFYAGKAGRTEIIAHGTTVDPGYYTGEPYYPHTPTMGCLCTMELWSGINGKRLESNQQKLVNALQKAGGARGYCVVIEIDDQQKAVDQDEILLLVKPQS